MSLDFYKSYLTIATDPSDTYIDDLQAVIDVQYENSASLYDIEEETAYGALEFVEKKYRVTKAISALTGVKLGDDFRKLIYPNTTSSKGLGWRYDFLDDYWIVSNSKNKDRITNSVTLRRCNSTAKFYNNNGVLSEEPCVLDYQLNETAPSYLTTESSPQGTIFLFMQYNDNSVELVENRRLLFGRRGVYNAYKIHGNKNFIDDNLVWFVLYREQVDEVRDDLVNGIANAYAYNYVLSLDTNDFEQAIGYTGQLGYDLKLNDDIVTRDVTWGSSDDAIGTVDSSGNIELLTLGDVIFTCTMDDNSDVSDSITVSSVATPVGVIEVRFEPNKTVVLSESGSVEYVVTKYVDDVVQADGFEFVLSGASNDNYIYNNIDTNTFTITSLGFDYTELKITVTSLVDSSVGTIDIQLKNAF